MKAILYSKKHNCWITFTQPLQVLKANTPAEVPDIIDRCEKANQAQGLWVAGFVTYEAAAGFDSALKVRPTENVLPYAVFGIFQEPFGKKDLQHMPEGTSAEINWQPEIDKNKYLTDLAYIKQKLSDGDTYQVNHTFRLKGEYSNSAEELFYLLAQAQPTNHAAFIELDDYAICSVSPELFFSKHGEKITSKPMKGTAPRGLSFLADKQAAVALQMCEKSQAENVMIVDMVRNDMGRVAVPGTVSVPELFSTEKYPTLWQMTSTVTCQSKASLKDIFTALFPCASITGAPKKAAMEIIADLETSPRGIYCGSIGMIDEDGDASFNVAIRTVTIDKRTNIAHYGSGGGIVWDSCPESEFEEACLKASMLTHSVAPEFRLLETMAYYPDDGYFLLDRHLDRIESSADYFAYRFDRAALASRLDQYTTELCAPGRIRVLIDKAGNIELQNFLLGDTPVMPARVTIAKSPVNSQNVFLYHKTTNRGIYENAVKHTPGYDDIILYNEKNEVTESTISNIIVKLDGKLYTPPVSCGLLGGTFRAYLLDTGEITEKIITLDMLKQADSIFLVNSVRKWREVSLQL